jgi:hypothetical protein
MSRAPDARGQLTESLCAVAGIPLALRLASCACPPARPAVRISVQLDLSRSRVMVVFLSSSVEVV